MPKISVVFSRYSYLTPKYDFRIQGQVYRLIIQLGQICLMQKSTANMLSRRCQNLWKSENTQVSEVNSNLYLEICQKHDTSLQSRDISCFVLFTVPFYHFRSRDIWNQLNVTFCQTFWFHFQIWKFCTVVIKEVEEGLKQQNN